MNRKKLTSLMLMGCATAAFAQEKTQPDLVLFIADDCSYYDLGCYGSESSLTPNIDRFAEEGMQFSRCYQAAPMSSPTRHNLYTGIWPVRSGAYPNHTHADDGTLSIVHHLRPAGYKLALAGKTHIGPRPVFPFDAYLPLVDGEIDYAAVSRFIDSCSAEDKPYCLIVASHLPHAPWDKGDRKLFKDEELVLPPMYVDTPETRSDFGDYLAEVNWMDREFGLLLDLLDRKGDPDNTCVVYLSEQGNGFPFAKWTCYDAGVHSACIVRWPGQVKAGSRSDALVEYVDVTPTFVDIAGAELAGPVDGKSFKNVLLGKRNAHKQYTYSLQTSRGIHGGPDHYGIRAVSDGRYRYILNLTPEAEFFCLSMKEKYFRSWEEKARTDAFAEGQIRRYCHRPAEELYDVAADPYCQHNLIGTRRLAKKTEELRARLKEWMDYCGDQGQATEMEAFEHMGKARKKQ